MRCLEFVFMQLGNGNVTISSLELYYRELKPFLSVYYNLRN
jgi:hypothetical protein